MIPLIVNMRGSIEKLIPKLLYCSRYDIDGSKNASKFFYKNSFLKYHLRGYSHRTYIREQGWKGQKVSVQCTCIRTVWMAPKNVNSNKSFAWIDNSQLRLAIEHKENGTFALCIKIHNKWVCTTNVHHNGLILLAHGI